MKIVLAPNSFKNSLEAGKVAKALQEGLFSSGLDCIIEGCPLGDGGDGTGALLRQYFNAKYIACKVPDPIGCPVNAGFGITSDGSTAIIELADASGLRILQPEDYKPLTANTKGTGWLLKEALHQNVSKIILCIGGSATVDGGTGILKELGVIFKNDSGGEIVDFPLGLINLRSIDTTHIDKRVLNTEIIILCDVKNRLLGKNGAAATFGPQKGANEYDVKFLENCLQKLSDEVYKTTGNDMSEIVYGGAAGGVAAALWAVCNAKPVSGIDYFLQQINFEKIIENADVIITGEGSLDKQTLDGKAPFGVAVTAKKYNIPVIAVAGKIAEEDKNDLQKYFDDIICINDADTPLEEALKNTYSNLVKAGEKIGKLFL